VKPPRRIDHHLHVESELNVSRLKASTRLRQQMLHFPDGGFVLVFPLQIKIVELIINRLWIRNIEH
jgi:hypothetical protein